MPYRKRRRYARKKDSGEPCPRERAQMEVPMEDRHNPALEAYYHQCGIVEEREWDAFLACLRSTLPMVVRINHCRTGWMALREELGRSAVVRSLPWFPNERVWQCSNEAYQASGAFKTMVQAQNKCGALTFQEAVSLVPALLLEPEPHHAVLDMCACPGSKTLQLLEMMHGSTAGPTVTSSQTNLISVTGIHNCDHDRVLKASCLPMTSTRRRW